MNLIQALLQHIVLGDGDDTNGDDDHANGDDDHTNGDGDYRSVFMFSSGIKFFWSSN